jgi:RNA polymerase sigma-70 factor (ECF subfamily)
MENTDVSLLTAHRQGDPTAFEGIVRRYGDNVFGYLMRMTANKEQAEDLFQETFKRVHEKAYMFRGKDLKNWLFKIATNVAIDGLRRHIRQQRKVIKLDCACDDNGESVTCAPADTASEPSVKAAKAEQVALVRQALDCLPQRQRATLILAYYQQLSYGEIADALGCSIGTVKTQMYRALRTLAQTLPEIEL